MYVLHLLTKVELAFLIACNLGYQSTINLIIFVLSQGILDEQ